MQATLANAIEAHGWCERDGRSESSGSTISTYLRQPTSTYHTSKHTFSAASPLNIFSREKPRWSVTWNLHQSRYFQVAKHDGLVPSNSQCNISSSHPATTGSGCLKEKHTYNTAQHQHREFRGIDCIGSKRSRSGRTTGIGISATKEEDNTLHSSPDSNDPDIP